MKIGYVRVSKCDGSHVLDLQDDAMRALDIDPSNIYYDCLSGKKDNRPGLDACLKALRSGDTLVVWKLDRLGRNLTHLVSTVRGLNDRGVGLKVIGGQWADIDTNTAAGPIIFGIFSALAEFERELNREQILAGLSEAHAKGKKSGRKHQLSKSQVLLAQTEMQKADTSVAHLCRELGVSRQTIYRYVSPSGELRDYGKQVINNSSNS